MCLLFQDIVQNLPGNSTVNPFYQDNGWRAGFPWLYYQRSAGEVLSQSKKVKLRVSFGYENPKIGIYNRLSFKLAQFDLEGNFLGFADLKDQLMICETSSEDIDKMRKFGSSIDQSCTFDLSRLTSSSAFDHPASMNIFYELYLVDYNGDLIDVPVLVNNMQDKVGNRPNLDSSSGNENGWRLVRRFFIFDTKSGVEGGTDKYVKGEVSTVIRYAKSITLRVKIDPDNEEMIYTPLVIIKYRERSKTGIQSNPLTTVNYSTEYL